MVFTAEEKSILNHFATSSEDNVYAIKKDVPPEVFGAFGSYFSRNPKDFREHLLDAIGGRIENEESNFTYKDLEWLIKGDFKDPTSAISRGIAKSQDFFRKWYGKYSHKSIANTVWIPMVAINVSQLFARELAYEQLAFFIEQSTRYVKWGLDKMFHDSEIMNSSYKESYINSLKTSIKGYDRLSEIAVEFYNKKNPFVAWLEKQPENIKKSNEEEQRAGYKRQIRGAALDVARFLLPQACLTNIAWILDARSTEFDIASWKGHPLSEIKTIADLIEKHAGQIAPSLLRYTEKNDYYSEKLNGYYGAFKNSWRTSQFKKGVEIISYDKNALDKSLSHIIKRHRFGGTFKEAYDYVKSLAFENKINILRAITEKRKTPDEWIEMDEEFDLTKIVFEIRTDIGAIRDWRRHQKWDRGESLYSLDNGCYRPFIIEEMGKEAKNLFDKVIDVSRETEQQIKKDFPYQAQYVLPMATMHSITMSGGLDQLQYILWTRTTPQGNFSYREDAFKIAKEVVKVHPWLLGYEKYPKKKSFIDVYNQAPLKSLLRLQTAEAELHS